MFDLGMQELILIFIVALLVFGPKRLPELGKTIGKGMRELKAALRGVQDSITDSETNILEEIKDAETSIKDSITSEISTNKNRKEEKEDRAETQEHGNSGKAEEVNKKKVNNEKD
jgi:sec-independent protein translocase protein TatB